jgi:hypothetical protein
MYVGRLADKKQIKCGRTQIRILKGFNWENLPDPTTDFVFFNVKTYAI